jgi:hypothetical protein
LSAAKATISKEEQKLLRDWDFTKFFQDINSAKVPSPVKTSAEAPVLTHRRVESDLKLRREKSDLFPHRSSLLFGVAKQPGKQGEPILTKHQPLNGSPWRPNMSSSGGGGGGGFRPAAENVAAAAADFKSRRRNSTHGLVALSSFPDPQLSSGAKVSPRVNQAKGSAWYF